MKLRLIAVVLAAIAFGRPLAACAQEKPLTKDEVLGLVRNQLGDETGARAVQQRGIDFEASEDFLTALKNAGAKEVFIEALRKASHAPVAPRPPEKPLTKRDVEDLTIDLKKVGDEAVVRAIEQRGIDFEPSEDFLKTFGGNEVIRGALRKAGHRRAIQVAGKRSLDIFAVFDLLVNGISSPRISQLIRERGIDFGPDRETLRTLTDLGAGEEVIHLVRRSEKGSDWRECPDPPVLEHARLAEEDYRARLRRDPRNWAVRYVLGEAYDVEGKGEQRVRLYQEWVRLNPEDARAHKMLGLVIELPTGQGDWGYDEGAIRELLVAVRLNPHDCDAHGLIAEALAPGNAEAFDKDPRARDAQLAEYRAAIRAQPPDCDEAYSVLEPSVQEGRELVRRAPNSAATHRWLGEALLARGDKAAALEELTKALSLAPDNSQLREEVDKLRKELNP